MSSCVHNDAWFRAGSLAGFFIAVPFGSKHPEIPSGPGGTATFKFQQSAGRRLRSDAIAAKLKDEETTLARLKGERAKTAQPNASRPLPHPTRIASDSKSVMGILQADPVRGREILARFVGAPCHDPHKRKPQPLEGDWGVRSIVLSWAYGRARKSSCAGLQLDFPARENPENPACWVPIVIAVGVGWTKTGRVSPGPQPGPQKAPSPHDRPQCNLPHC